MDARRRDARKKGCMSPASSSRSLEHAAVLGAVKDKPVIAQRCSASTGAQGRVLDSPCARQRRVRVAGTKECSASAGRTKE